jgi:uncharacterized protein
MKLETARRGIDFVIRNSLRKSAGEFSIAYHGGGEPTANWNVLTGSHRYAREVADRHQLSFSAAAATNGVLRDEQIEWVMEHLDGGVSLSFDGLPDVHDRHRLTVLGHGSSQRVIHTLRRFDAAGYRYGIRVTVTHEHIARLPESVEYICTNFRPVRIQVEPAYQLGRWAHAPSAETEAFIAAFREAREAAARHSHEIVYSAARLDTLTNHFCGITQDSFALTPDGNVSACYEAFSENNPLADVFVYGKPDPDSQSYQFDLPVLDNLRSQTVEHREFCRGCFAKWHCAGDCYHKSLSVNGREAFVGSERCHITRELTKDQILDRLAQAGGWFWHEPVADVADHEPHGKELLL